MTAVRTTICFDNHIGYRQILKILVANHVSRILYLAIFIREHNICLFRKQLVGNGTTTLILSLPLASCLFSQKCVFPVEVLLKAACTEFKYRGEIGTEVLICILKGNNTDYQWVPVLSYCKEEVHLHGFWSLRKASSLHLHTNICISGLCTDIWTSVTRDLQSHWHSAMSKVVWLYFFILSNAWRWCMCITHSWYNLGSWIFYLTDLQFVFSRLH